MTFEMRHDKKLIVFLKTFPQMALFEVFAVNGNQIRHLSVFTVSNRKRNTGESVICRKTGMGGFVASFSAVKHTGFNEAGTDTALFKNIYDTIVALRTDKGAVSRFSAVNFKGDTF